MDSKALHRISYGLYIITSKKDDALNGQAVNALMQICSDPLTVAAAINKQNLTHEYIQNSKHLAVSVLDRETPLELIGRFGFKSGRNLDKFQGMDYRLTAEGLPYLVKHTLSYFAAKVVREVDAWTHTIFIGAVNDGGVLREGIPMTYAYYLEVKRGGVPKTAPTYNPGGGAK
jgi:flavin reductase (DIM6/NTAB) family NADH-FMN oxidoreductase RutF